MKCVKDNMSAMLLLLLLVVTRCCHGDGRRYVRGYQLNNTIDGDRLQFKSDIYLETTDMVLKHGYPVETHKVQTEDGYVLSLHRIPHGRSSGGARVRPPILVMHGLLAASDLWTLMGPEKGLGFLLAEEGYDVWLGNARGNYYSREHVSLSPAQSKFWDFSFHEMGTYDLPAFIDYILATTNQKQLFYLGHSMGTTMFFVLTSTIPEYNDKIKLMVALAPVAYNGKLRNTFGQFFLPYSRNIIDGYFRSNQLELFPRIKSRARLAENACQDGQLTQTFCKSLYFSVFGIDSKQLNSTMLPVFWSHLLSGTSVATVDHFIENHKSDIFQWYDKSRRRRRMTAYNLSQITAPVSLHYAMNDALLHPEGVVRLSKLLPNLVNMVRLPDDDANHIDFALAIQVKQLVYNDVMHIINKYNT